MGTNVIAESVAKVYGPSMNPALYRFKVVAPNPYVVGGIVIPLPRSGLGKIIGAFVVSPARNGRVWDWDGSTTAPKLKAYTTYPGTEAGAVDVSADGTVQGFFVLEN